MALQGLVRVGVERIDLRIAAARERASEPSR